MFILNQVTGVASSSSSDAGLAAMVFVIFALMAIAISAFVIRVLRSKKTKNSLPPQRIFGTPGKSLNSAYHFTDANIKSGIEGEVKTAEIINNFVLNSTNCYAFHSLRWPMSTSQADIDHIIVCGNNLLIIDSKNWSQKGVYSFDFSGDVVLDSKKYKFGNQPKVFAAREKYQDFIHKISKGYFFVEVHSVIVIQNEKSSVVPKPYLRFNHLSTGHEFESFLRDWELSRGIVYDNRKLLWAIRSLLK